MDMPEIQASSRPAHFMFAIWAMGLDRVPTTAEIMDKAHVSHYSAMAWRRDWIAVRAWLATGEWRPS